MKKKSSLLILSFLLLLLFSCSKDNSDEPKLSKGDLSIRYIQKLPEINYVWNNEIPTVEGWPEVNQEITWSAHIYNHSNLNQKNVSYIWLLDGYEIKSGTFDIQANKEISIDLKQAWSFDRHKLKLTIDPKDIIKESEEYNNDLEIFTDALSIGLYIEESLYAHFLKNQYKLNAGSVTFDDWAQCHIDSLNLMFADAIYTLTPNGVLDRVRIDKITIVPDAALPLVPIDTISQIDAGPHTHPNIEDFTVDMQWGFPAKNTDLYTDFNTRNLTNPFYFQGSFLHELGHARYLTDVYGFNLLHGLCGDSVLIEENGELIAGTPFLPGIPVSGINYQGVIEHGLLIYATSMDGLMNNDYTYIDEYSAILLNLISGYRATHGNCNLPYNYGCYFNDLPLENQLTLKSKSGAILANADIKIYQATGVSGALSFFSQRIDNTPDIQLITDDQGKVKLGQNPFSNNPIKHDWEVSNIIAIVRVEHNDKVGFTFLDSSLFNLQFWSGNTEFANYELEVELIDPDF